MKRILPAVLALALWLPLAPAAGGVSLPDPENTGNFEGTWYYSDPSFQIAIFIARDATGALHLKYHVRGKGGTEYETDEGGYVKWIDEGKVVEILFTGSLGDSHRIKGYHERTIRTKTSTVQESGDFELYLAEKGQKLVLRYPKLKTATTTPDGRTATDVREEVSRIFRRASTIVVDFSEIPF